MAIQTFEPRGRIEALLAALLRKTLQGLLKPIFTPRFAITFQRRWLRAISALTRVPRGLRFEAAVVGGVAGEWVRLAAGTARRGTLLYLHGGAYCVGSSATHRALTGRLARATGMAVFALDYRLAPEHRFPAAVDDALAACRALQAGGPVVIAGDSAGGGLAVATALALRDGGHGGPAALLLFSPWVDMSLAQTPSRPPAGEAMLSAAWVGACAAHCLGGADAGHPWASPLHADLHGLPPTLIQAGTDEMLHAEALRLHDALQAAGVAVHCEITARRWHVFQMHAGVLRSADEALERAADFVGRTVDALAPADATITHEVVILGAGMSGLCMAIQLKKAGRHDFVVLEQSEPAWAAPGGTTATPARTWTCRRRCTPSPSRPTRAGAALRRRARDPGLHGALRAAFRRAPHLRFSTQISDARFDEPAGRWRITTARGQTLVARFFVCSTGPLSRHAGPTSRAWKPFAAASCTRRAGTPASTPAACAWASSAPAPRRRSWCRRWRRARRNCRLPAHRQLGAAAAWTGATSRSTAGWPTCRRTPLVRAFWYRVLEWGRRGFDEGTLARAAC
jgi:acetyl esterase/lipase